MNELLTHLEQLFQTSPWLGLGASFLAGLLASFSPCMYPLIPITVGILGGAAVSSQQKTFHLSLVFVLGVALTYTVLGVFSSLFGIFFAQFFRNAITYFALTFLFIFLSLSLFGLLRIPMFSFSPDYTLKRTALSLFGFGIISGFAFIPCIFPVLGAILVLISLKENIFYGICALFLFSIGQCMLLLILGTSTSLVRRLPKSGKWLILIKRGFGVVLLGIAVFFAIKGVLLLL